MLEKCLVRVISRIVVKNNVYFEYKAIFILFAGKYDCIPCTAIFRCIGSPKDSSRWLQPPCIQCGGVREKICIITLDPTSWSVKEVIARRTRQPDYIAIKLSLSHGSLMVGLLCSPWYMRVHPNTGACAHGRETALR